MFQSGDASKAGTKEPLNDQPPHDKKAAAASLKLRPKSRPSTAVGARINTNKLMQTITTRNANDHAETKPRPQTAMARTSSSTFQRPSRTAFASHTNKPTPSPAEKRTRKSNAVPLWKVQFDGGALANPMQHQAFNPRRKPRPRTAFPNSLRPSAAKARAYAESPTKFGRKDLERTLSPGPNPGYLFNMPRPTPEPEDDGERLPSPEPRNNSTRKQRTEITLFVEESAACSKDNSYKDTFNRSMSRNDPRYVGATKNYPKMPVRQNVPTRGTTLNKNLANFRLLEGPLDCLSPLDAYRGDPSPWGKFGLQSP